MKVFKTREGFGLEINLQQLSEALTTDAKVRGQLEPREYYDIKEVRSTGGGGSLIVGGQIEELVVN